MITSRKSSQPGLPQCCVLWGQAGQRFDHQQIPVPFGRRTSRFPITADGLGARETVDAILVRWTDGTTERFAGVAADQRVVVERGAGVPE